jgi:hypothetical protein
MDSLSDTDSTKHLINIFKFHCHHPHSVTKSSYWVGLQEGVQIVFLMCAQGAHRKVATAGNRNATAISENCYQPELNHMLLNGATQIDETATQLGERLKNSTSRQRNTPVFSQLRCSVVS